MTSPLAIAPASLRFFDHCTNELAQDAFICWLMAHADQAPQSPAGQAGLRLLNYMIGQTRSRRLPNGKLVCIRTVTQQDHIDVLIYAVYQLDDGGEVLWTVLIEDKTGTIQHDDQLTRYVKALLDRQAEPKIDEQRLACIYLQTGDQGDFYTVGQTDFCLIDRPKFLELLKDHDRLGGLTGDLIVDDFVAAQSARQARLEGHAKAFWGDALPKADDPRWAPMFLAVARSDSQEIATSNQHYGPSWVQFNLKTGWTQFGPILYGRYVALPKIGEVAAALSTPEFEFLLYLQIDPLSCSIRMIRVGQGRVPQDDRFDPTFRRRLEQAMCKALKTVGASGADAWVPPGTRRSGATASLLTIRHGQGLFGVRPITEQAFKDDLAAISKALSLLSTGQIPI